MKKWIFLFSSSSNIKKKSEKALVFLLFILHCTVFYLTIFFSFQKSIILKIGINFGRIFIQTYHLSSTVRSKQMLNKIFLPYLISFLESFKNEKLNKLSKTFKMSINLAKQNIVQFQFHYNGIWCALSIILSKQKDVPKKKISIQGGWRKKKELFYVFKK